MQFINNINLTTLPSSSSLLRDTGRWYHETQLLPRVCVFLWVWQRADHRLMFNPSILWPRVLTDLLVEGPPWGTRRWSWSWNMGGWGSSCQLGLIVYLKMFPLKAQSEPCPQCKHSSEPLSSKADMLAGALLSIWRLTKVHAGEEARLYQCSETDGLQLITPLQSTYHKVSFRINKISKGVSGLNIHRVNTTSF